MLPIIDCIQEVFLVELFWYILVFSGKNMIDEMSNILLRKRVRS